MDEKEKPTGTVLAPSQDHAQWVRMVHREERSDAFYMPSKLWRHTTPMFAECWGLMAVNLWVEHWKHLLQLEEHLQTRENRTKKN